MEFFYEPKTEEQLKIKGRDYFHNPGEDYWKRISFDVIDSVGEKVTFLPKYFPIPKQKMAASLPSRQLFRFLVLKFLVP